jgi:glycosyltransferase involved in cell wall biosynthesis
MYVPMKEAAKHGHEVTFLSIVDYSHLHIDVIDPVFTTAEQAEGADIFIGQRVNAYGGLGQWRRLYTPDRKLVYENDDDVWHVTPDNPGYETYKEGGETREAVKRYCDTANLITCTTPYLADLHRTMADNRVPVEVLPNYLPGWVLDLAKDDRKGHPRIGWIGGSSHSLDLQVPGDAVKRFMKRFPEWHLFISGMDFRSQIKAPDCAVLGKEIRPTDRSFHIPWIPVCQRPELFYRSIDFDIGIAPLRPTEFVNSKSPVKPLEYAARGIPCIATDVGPYRNFIKHGETGFLVKQDHEWLKYMSILAADEDMRLAMGAAAKKQAEEYIIEKHWQEWINAYSRLFPVGWTFQDGSINT